MKPQTLTTATLLLAITWTALPVIALPQAEIATLNAQLQKPQAIAQSICTPAYPDVCIPSTPPDLNCKDIRYRNFRVLPPDPHGFDKDGDGIGCEK